MGTRRKTRPKPGDWDYKKIVWQRAALKERPASILRHFELNAGRKGYPVDPPDRATITDILSEFDDLSADLIATLPTEVQSYAISRRPALKAELEHKKQERLATEINWIEEYEAKHGKLPSLPEPLGRLVANYKPGQPVCKDMVVVIASMQSWREIKSIPGLEKKWREFLEWKGEDPDEYEFKVRQLAAPSGKTRGSIEAQGRARFHPSTAGAMRKHNEKLMLLLREWTSQFHGLALDRLVDGPEVCYSYELFISRKPDGGKTLFLLDCLKEHLSGDVLLKYCDEWERLALAFDETKKKIRSGVEQDVDLRIRRIMADSLKQREPREFSEECLRVRSRWGEYVESLRKFHGLDLDWWLRDSCEPVAVKGNTIVLEFYKSLSKDRMGEPQFARILEEKLGQVFGSPNKIRFVLAAMPPPDIDNSNVVNSVLKELGRKRHTGTGETAPDGSLRIRVEKGSVYPDLLDDYYWLARASNGILDAVKDLRRSLLEKWRPAVEPLGGIVDDLAKVTGPLRKRSDTLIEKGVVPGRCRACPDA